MNTQQQGNLRPDASSSFEPADKRSDKAPEETCSIRFSLTKTARLHGISKSYLSRRVKEGKPAKGHDLTEQVQVERGRIQGFLFRPGYEFPGGKTAREVKESGDGKDGRSDLPGDGQASPPPGEPTASGKPPEQTGNERTPRRHSGVETRPASGGYARTADELYAGKEVWGRLQRVSEEGELQFLRHVPSEKAVTIEDVSETYGAGRYRISSVEDGKEVHISFSISRRSPAAVDRRLARTDELEQMIAELTTWLEERDEEINALREENNELKMELTEVREMRDDAKHALERLQDRFDEELRMKKREEVREETETLREELREEKKKRRLETSKLRQEKRALEDEMWEMEKDHEIEKIKMRGDHERELYNQKWKMEERAIEKIGALAEAIRKGGEKNSEEVQALFELFLQKLGLFEEDGDNRPSERPGRSEEPAPGGEGSLGSEAEEGAEENQSFNSALLDAYVEEVLRSETTQLVDGETVPTREEVIRRAPLLPGNEIYLVFCPQA